MRTPILVGLSLAAVACSNIPAVDNSPRSSALVRVDQVELSGGTGYFPYRGRQVTWTRPQARRIQQQVEFTASALGAFGAGAERAYLFDLSRPSLVQVGYDSASYHRCGMLGCYEYSEATRSVEPQPPVLGGPDCGLQVKDAHLSLNANGEKRSLAGFDATGHRFEWRVVVADERGRLAISRLHGSVWLADSPEALPDRTYEQRFEAGYRAALGRSWPVIQDYAPWLALGLVESYFLDNLSPGQRRQAFAFEPPGQQTSAVLGGELNWSVAGRACGWRPAWQQAGEAPAGDNATEKASPPDGIETLGDFISAIAAELSGDNQPPETLDESDIQSPEGDALPTGRSVFGYRWALQSWSVGEVSEKQLRVPPEFAPGTRF